MRSKNVLAVIYEDEKTSYEVLSELKNRSGTSEVLQAGLVKNVRGSLVVKDGWTTDENANLWIDGGIIGALIGILGGPVGMLLGTGIGMVLGEVSDKSELDEQSGIIEQVASELKDQYLALILIAEEEDNSELDSFFANYGTEKIMRCTEGSILEEMELAKKTETELRKEAKSKMRKERKRERKEEESEEWSEKAEELRKKIIDDTK